MTRVECVLVPAPVFEEVVEYLNWIAHEDSTITPFKRQAQGLVKQLKALDAYSDPFQKET
jgi:hypothetical protein